uniref:Uncharacterized protein n=1 Tax=Arundo donax TaxID=35708 RepID=A0A0A9C3F4_ARUDO
MLVKKECHFYITCTTGLFSFLFVKWSFRYTAETFVICCVCLGVGVGVHVCSVLVY